MIHLLGLHMRESGFGGGRIEGGGRMGGLGRNFLNLTLAQKFLACFEFRKFCEQGTFLQFVPMRFCKLGWRVWFGKSPQPQPWSMEVSFGSVLGFENIWDFSLLIPFCCTGVQLLLGQALLPSCRHAWTFPCSATGALFILWCKGREKRARRLGDFDKSGKRVRSLRWEI